MKLFVTLAYKTICATLILSAGLTLPGLAHADAALDDVQVQGAEVLYPTEYKGVINRLGSNGRSIIVDDTLLNLDNLVLVNGETWSRERALGALQEGTHIRFQLKQGPSGRLPTIVSLKFK